jgi:hypothetical protein
MEGLIVRSWVPVAGLERGLRRGRSEAIRTTGRVALQADQALEALLVDQKGVVFGPARQLQRGALLLGLGEAVGRDGQDDRVPPVQRLPGRLEHHVGHHLEIGLRF